MVLIENGTILILPLDTSICGVDLVCANHIIFPHMTSGDNTSRLALEKQAVCRVLRHGQQKKVIVHHFVITDGCEAELLNDTSLDNQ